MSEPTPSTKPSVKQRLEKLVNEYGPVAIGVHFAIFLLTLAGFVVAIRTGVKLDSSPGQAGLLAAAYVATKLTTLPRLAITLGVTPVVAKLWRKLSEKPSTPG